MKKGVKTNLPVNTINKKVNPYASFPLPLVEEKYTKKDIKNVLEEIWDDIRALYIYPLIDIPEIMETCEGGAFLDFSNRKKPKIFIGSHFINKTTSAGISLEEALKGINIHEIGHYMTFPKTLSTIIFCANLFYTYFKNKDGCDEKILNFMFQLYADLVNDTASVLTEKRKKDVLKFRETSQRILQDELNRDIRAVLLAYMYHQDGLDFNTALDKALSISYNGEEKLEKKKEFVPYLEEMDKLDLFNEKIEQLRVNIYRFGSIILEIINKYKKKNNCNIELNTDGIDNDMDIDKILLRTSEENLKEALREIALKVTKKEYEEIKEWLKEKGLLRKESDKGEKEKGNQDVSIETSEGKLPIDQEVLDYYKELSSHMPIVVAKKPIKTKKPRIVVNKTERYAVGEDPTLIIPESSSGKILPNITRKINIGRKPKTSRDYKVPNLLIVIDSSGSMPDPKEEKSYAVLAAYCAARSYHINGSYIGVINFSGKSFYLPYTRKLNDALGAISAYQGGGTKVDIQMLRKMLNADLAKLYEEMYEKNMLNIRELPQEVIKKNIEINIKHLSDALLEGHIDLLMFTDGGIYNIGEVITFLEERININRVTIVLSDRFKEFSTIPEYFENKKIRVYKVSKEEDIVKITIDNVKESINEMGSC
jgi:hypothetical protein